MRRNFLLTLSACLFATTLVGCELVADFDRDQIPTSQTDSGVKPILDAGADRRDSGAEDDASSASK